MKSLKPSLAIVAVTGLLLTGCTSSHHSAPTLKPTTNKNLASSTLGPSVTNTITPRLRASATPTPTVTPTPKPKPLYTFTSDAAPKTLALRLTYRGHARTYTSSKKAHKLSNYCVVVFYKTSLGTGTYVTDDQRTYGETIIQQFTSAQKMRTPQIHTGSLTTLEDDPATGKAARIATQTITYKDSKIRGLLHVRVLPNGVGFVYSLSCPRNSPSGITTAKDVRINTK